MDLDQNLERFSSLKTLLSKPPRFAESGPRRFNIMGVIMSASPSTRQTRGTDLLSLICIRDDLDNPASLKEGAAILFFLPDESSHPVLDGRIGDVFVGFHLTTGHSGAMVVNLPCSRYFILDGDKKELDLNEYPASVYVEAIRNCWRRVDELKRLRERLFSKDSLAAQPPFKPCWYDPALDEVDAGTPLLEDALVCPPFYSLCHVVPNVRASLGAVLVAQSWLLQHGAQNMLYMVLWDGTLSENGSALPVFASTTLPKTIAIIREAVEEGNGWISIQDAWVNESNRNDGLELELSSRSAQVRWIAVHNPAVRMRKDWAVENEMDVPVPRFFETSQGKQWRCSKCSFFTYLGKSHCYLCGKAYCVQKDKMVFA